MIMASCYSLLQALTELPEVSREEILIRQSRRLRRDRRLRGSAERRVGRIRELRLEDDRVGLDVPERKIGYEHARSAGDDEASTAGCDQLFQPRGGKRRTHASEGDSEALSAVSSRPPLKNEAPR